MLSHLSSNLDLLDESVIREHDEGQNIKVVSDHLAIPTRFYRKPSKLMSELGQRQGLVLEGIKDMGQGEACIDLHRAKQRVKGLLRRTFMLRYN